MALKLILGPAGSGKTTYCTEDIIASAAEDKSPLYYIVPEQYTLEAEKSLVAKFAGNSLIKAQVLSFERLSFHVLSETGAAQSAILDSTGKSMVLRKILYDISPQLKYYNNTPISAGFIQSISRTVTELFRQRGGEAGLPVMPGAYRSGKFEDIRLIFEAYKSFIENDYISSDTSLDILNQNIGKSRLFHGAAVWIDNFTGFSAQEYKVIENLLKLASEVNICINFAGRSLNYSSPAPDDLYYEPKFLINKLLTIAKEINVKVTAPVFCEGAYRYKNSPELKWLLENYDKPRPEAFSGENKRVILNSYPDKYAEAVAVADNIIRLVRDEGLSFRDIAVLPGDMQGYAPVIQNTFERYNIPCFVDIRTGILFHPLSEFICALFDIISKNWSYESVFRLIKTNLTGISEDETDILENYAREYAVRGGRWKQEEWDYGFTENSPYDKAAIHSTKEAVYNTINEFCGKYTSKGKVNPLDVCKDIYNFLIKLKMPDKLTELAMEAASDGDMYLYRIHSGIWNVIMGVLDKIAGIFGGGGNLEMTAAEFGDILLMGLSSCDMGIIPPSQDQVIIGDMYRSRLSDIKAVFIIGMTAELIPKRAENEGLFDDSDKAFLESCGIELGANSDKQTYINSHTVFGALTKAGGYLFLYCPEKDAGGKAAAPSPLLWKIRQLFNFPKESEVRESGESGGEGYISLPGPMLEKLGAMLSDASDKRQCQRELAGALINWYSRSGDYADKVRKALRGTQEIQPLSPKALSSLYKADTLTSVSRIEKYADCPFSYFLRYNLNLKERADYKIKDIDLGNVFHEIMERYTARLQGGGLDWGSIDYQESDKIVDDIFADFEGSGKGDIFSYDAKSGYILERVKKLTKRSVWALSSHISAGRFKPYAAEINFDRDAGITVDINDTHKFTLTGRIDRVDLLESGGETYVKIIDYKSGAAKLDITDVYYGRQLQLLTYMGALTRSGDKILGLPQKPKPGGLFYFRFDDPVADYDEGAERGEIYDAILSKFKLSGLLLKDKELIEGMDSGITKSSSVIPVTVNKSGEYTSRSEALVSENDFQRVLDFAYRKISETGKKILSGSIAARPYKKGMRSGCDYCPYLSVCGFNEKEAKYNNFRKIKSLGELK